MSIALRPHLFTTTTSSPLRSNCGRENAGDSEPGEDSWMAVNVLFICIAHLTGPNPCRRVGHKGHQFISEPATKVDFNN